MKMSENMYVPLRYRDGWRLSSGKWFPWFLFLPWLAAFCCGVIMLFYALSSSAYSSPTQTMQWTALVEEVESTETTTGSVSAYGESNDSKTR